MLARSLRTQVVSQEAMRQHPTGTDPHDMTIGDKPNLKLECPGKITQASSSHPQTDVT
jgi:hypothetical protein